MVHRLLAAAIGDEKALELVSGLTLKKSRVDELCANMNFRHRMAQYAGRASVSLHTLLYFRGRRVDQQAFVLSVKRNALRVYIPKFGLEGPIFLDSRDCVDAGVEFEYDEEVCVCPRGGIVGNFLAGGTPYFGVSAKNRNGPAYDFFFASETIALGGMPPAL